MTEPTTSEKPEIHTKPNTTSTSEVIQESHSSQ